MTNVAELYAWTERDMYTRHDELFEAVKGSVRLQESGSYVDLAVEHSRSDLTAHLTSLGYDVDHLETLALQAEVINAAQARLDDELGEEAARAEEAVASAIRHHIPEWQTLDAVQLETALTDEVFMAIDGDLDFYRATTDEAEAMRHLGDYFDRRYVIDRIRQMQQEMPPDKPPFKGIVQIAGIQEVDKG